MSDTGDIKRQIESVFQDNAHNAGIAFAGSFHWADVAGHPDLSVTYTPPLNKPDIDFNPQVQVLFDKFSGYMTDPFKGNEYRGVYDVTLDGDPKTPNGLQVTLHIDRANIKGALSFLLSERDYKWGEDFKERVNSDILSLLQHNVPPERILAVVERLEGNWKELLDKQQPIPEKSFYFESDPDEALAHPTAESRLKQFELAYNQRAGSIANRIYNEFALTDHMGEIWQELRNAIEESKDGPSVLAQYTAKINPSGDGRGGGRAV